MVPYCGEAHLLQQFPELLRLRGGVLDELQAVDAEWVRRLRQLLLDGHRNIAPELATPLILTIDVVNSKAGAERIAHGSHAQAQGSRDAPGADHRSRHRRVRGARL